MCTNALFQHKNNPGTLGNAKTLFLLIAEGLANFGHGLTLDMIVS